MITVEVCRGNFVESRHQVMAAVVNEKGQLVESFGNPDFVTSPRSAIKMLQALPLVASGAADFYNLSPQQICLACASHNSEDQQLEWIDKWMTVTGISESWLHCGPHEPYHIPTQKEWIKIGRKPTPKANNCSGKHLGMMTTSLYLKEDPQAYYDYHQPRQVALRKLLSEITEYDHDKAPWGIDGCGIPTYGVPLVNMAKGMSYLIRPNKVSKELQYACETILTSVSENPYYISGTGEFTTEIIRASEGRCLIKVGAEGMFCGVLPEKGYAFALKAIDGNGRGAQNATAWLLEQLGGIYQYKYPEIKNWAGESVGQIRVFSEDRKTL